MFPLAVAAVVDVAVIAAAVDVAGPLATTGLVLGVRPEGRTERDLLGDPTDCT